MSDDPWEILDIPLAYQRELTLTEKLRDRACPAGLPHTGDDPASDHGHTDCWLFHAAAVEIERLRDAITEALDLCSDIRCDEHDEEPCPWCLTEILTNALEGNDR